MRPRGWFSAVSQITLSSVKLCRSLNDVNSCDALWNETLRQMFNIFHGSKMRFVFIKTNVNAFHAF
jgi:hypothetical protein